MNTLYQPPVPVVIKLAVVAMALTEDWLPDNIRTLLKDAEVQHWLQSMRNMGWAPEDVKDLAATKPKKGTRK